MGAEGEAPAATIRTAEAHGRSEVLRLWEAPTATEAAALRIASSSFAAAIFRNRRPNPRRFSIHFRGQRARTAHSYSLSFIRYSYFPSWIGGFLVTMYEPPGMFRAWAGTQKNGLTDMEFVIRHDVLGRNEKINSTNYKNPSHPLDIRRGD